MISTNIGGTPVWLVPFPANEGRVNGTFEKPTKRGSGKSARENRMAVAKKLRTSFTFKTVLNAAEAQTLRDFLRDMDNRPVLVPFWPAESLASNYSGASMDGALRVWFEPDWTSWQITTTLGAGSPLPVTATLRTCPLCWGRLTKSPVYGAANGLGDGTVNFDFTETGAAEYALVPRNVTLPTGDWVRGIPTPVLGVPVDWSDTPEQSSTIIVDRSHVGYGRGDVEEFITQPARRTQSLRVTAMDSGEVARILRLFDDRDASLSPWWCPASHSSAAANRLLVRFASDKIAIKWERPSFGGNEIARADIDVVELPTELNEPFDESVGATIGAMPAKWWGYIVTAGGNTYRYTSYESDIDAGGLGTFTRAPIEHGDITKGLNLAKHECPITVGAFAGSPFEVLRIQPNGYDIKVQIVEGAVSAPSGATTIFTGKLTDQSFSGSILKAKIAGLTSLFDMQVPVQVASSRCWTPLFSGPCGLSRAAKQVSATLTEQNGAMLTFSFASGSFASDWFRYGYAERSFGGVQQRYPITGSAASSGTSITVAINGEISPQPSLSESGWTLIPGCDHSYSRCKVLGGKFRGFPHFPKANPALVPVKQSTPAGGKK